MPRDGLVEAVVDGIYKLSQNRVAYRLRLIAIHR